jgi:drug/metabolite transporter (DMT)-like permease
MSTFYLVFLGALWGLHFSVIRFAAESGIDYTDIAGFVVAGVLLVLLFICWFRDKFPRITKSTMAFYLICAVFGYLIPFFVELFSSVRIGAGLLTVVVSLTPVATVAIALMLRSESVRLPKVLAIGFGLVAVAPLFAFNEIALEAVFGMGLAAALIVPVSYAIYNNYVSKYWPEDMDSWQVATGEAIAAGLILGPLLLINGSHDFAALFEPENGVIVLIFILFSFLEIFLYFEIVRLCGAIFVSQASFVTVITGIAWSVFFFDEEFGSWIWASMLALSASIYLSTRSTETAIVIARSESS